MEPGNYLHASVPRLAQALGIDYGHALRSWKILAELKLVTPEVNEFGRTVCYRLSPALAWRGRPWTADLAQRQIDAQAELQRLASLWGEDQPEEPA